MMSESYIMELDENCFFEVHQIRTWTVTLSSRIPDCDRYDIFYEVRKPWWLDFQIGHTSKYKKVSGTLYSVH